MQTIHIAYLNWGKKLYSSHSTCIRENVNDQSCRINLENIFFLVSVVLSFLDGHEFPPTPQCIYSPQRHSPYLFWFSIYMMETRTEQGRITYHSGCFLQHFYVYNCSIADNSLKRFPSSTHWLLYLDKKVTLIIHRKIGKNYQLLTFTLRPISNYASISTCAIHIAITCRKILKNC